MDFHKPEVLNVITGNIANNFKQFNEEVLIYIEATETDKKPNKVQVARLKNLLGSDALKLYNTLKSDDDKNETVLSILKTLENHCLPKKNETMAIHMFFSRKQQEGESFDKYYIDLKSLIQHCEFKDQEDKILRSQIIIGISSSSTNERLLRHDVSLEKVVQYCKSVEVAESNMKVIEDNRSKETAFRPEIENITRKPRPSLVEKGWSQSPNQGRSTAINKQEPINNCTRCGYVHNNRPCPARNKTCSKCKKPNHFAQVCRSQTSNSHEIENNDPIELAQPVNEEVGTVVNMAHSIKEHHWTVTVEIYKTPIVFKIDTGADVNILSANLLNSLSLPENFTIQPSRSRLEAFGGFKINTLGEITLPVNVASKLSQITFVIVDNEKATPIIGLYSSVALGLICRDSVNAIDKIPDVNTLIEQNKEVFYNQGCFPDILKLRLKEGAISKSSPARRVPNKISEPLKLKLQSLEARGIIKKCEAGEWVHNLVVVEKHQTKDLRICIDPKELNRYLIRDYVLIPTLDEITAKLAKKKYFCVFDLKDGFHQILMDEESSKLCTFSTPFGVYRYLRAPFGLSILPEYFQSIMTKYFGAIENVVVYFDDILCAAETEQELYQTVLDVLRVAKDNKIQLNKDKIQYFVEEVRFLGQKFDCKGVKPDSERIKAVTELKAPTNRRELQSVLGTINYLRPFVPNLAEHCSHFQELLKKNVLFQWTSHHSNQFEKLKDKVKNAALLSPFDPKAPITIQADSSSFSLGCSLFQHGNPIMYCSRSLSESEKDYAQIEKELLAIVYAFQKFHNFAYGHSEIEVQSDHAPLLSILNKHIHQIVNNRLRRLRLKLLPYSFTIKFISGKKLYVADLLSRQCAPTATKEDESMLDVVHTVNEVKINPKTVDQYIKSTKEDEALSNVLYFYKNGWPNNYTSNIHELNHYFSIRNDITVQSDLVYYNDRLVVPQSLRRYTLQTLHETHLGFNKLKLKVQELIYWPGLISDLKNLISSCATCAKFQRAKVKEPLNSHEIFDLPFYKLATDIAEFEGTIYLVVVDYFSRWIEVERLRDKSASSVITVLKPMFARFGIPSILVCDNVPFNSREFIDFSKSWNFEVKLTSPYYPRSNGLAEKSVGIVKTMLRKAKHEKTDLSLYLLNYRSTPVASLKYSPSQLLQSRVLNIKLPISPSKLKPHIVVDNKVTEKSGQKEHYNKTALKQESVFIEGQKVLVRNVSNRQWEEGVIRQALGNRSYLVEMNGRVVRRTSWHIRSSHASTRSGRRIVTPSKLNL